MSNPTHANGTTLPLLYSYVNCPYCIRARLAIVAGDIPVRLREVALPQKPQELLNTSPKGTVPVLVLNNGTLIDQSLAVVDWAISQSDPIGLGHHHAPEEEIAALIEENDTRFAKALIRVKYPERFKDEPQDTDWQAVVDSFLDTLEERLSEDHYLAGGHATRVDIAIVPFVLQYSLLKADALTHVPYVAAWVKSFAGSTLYKRAMQVYPAWSTGDVEPVFP